MIDKAEIDSKSAELGVHVAKVQRDYVFGCLLAGIFQDHAPLARTLTLKGGNAFRKAYFEHARFSNDLDFSTREPMNEAVLRDAVVNACRYASERCGIEFRPNESRVRLKRLVETDLQVYEARVYFKSFYAEENITLKVSLDVTEFDRIYLPVQSRRPRP